MTTLLSPDQIETAISNLPPQLRIMLRLLLLQYLDITPEDIEHIAADRPDPRMLAGMKKTSLQITKDSLRSISERVEQYRSRLRQKRERIALQTECLAKQIALTESYSAIAEHLLKSRFAFESSAVESLKQAAATAVLKPMVRELEARWDRDEITEEEYHKGRVAIEYQLLRRKLSREKKRMEHARREEELSCLVPLQDHEIAHVWGIPIGTLTARKVKAMHQYLEALQAGLKESATLSMPTPPVDLWKETFLSLARRPVSRSVGTYDGLERTETQLMEKLTGLTHGTLPEEHESRLWELMTQESKPAGEYGSTLQSLFALQRYSALLSEVDATPEILEQDFLRRISPKPKAATPMLEAEAARTGPELGEIAEHVLRSFTGEDHSDTRAKR
jgi:hypothetical protein